MAIDTDTRKLAAINIGCPWRGVNLVPSGALDTEEELAIMYLYNEFTPSELQIMKGGASQVWVWHLFNEH